MLRVLGQQTVKIDGNKTMKEGIPKRSTREEIRILGKYRSLSRTKTRILQKMKFVVTGIDSSSLYRWDGLFERKRDRTWMKLVKH